ncbi:Signal transduction response regulator, receiver domain [Desulfonema limicola]|uniref:Signal transduction response regulator, receiver domain n=1 Tax=Desulfonema limicola TaxID=45656 RepID=A0A975B3K9_9BACT|nr:response regulator [Desulfonema limicola]QTA78153.1 Signal transduction response regulator, receiver domain [Desulfonema limicola]
MSNDLENARILIVDDMATNLQVLGTILKERGFHTNIARNGREAIVRAEKVCPDLILLDVMMPEMDGFEACRQLKNIETTKHIPIIFLTAKTETESVVKGFDLGAADYVLKPFNSAELLARVQTHLDLKRSRDIIDQKNQDLLDKNKALIKLNKDLQNALAEIKTLKGILPICSNCKKIRLENSDPRKQESWVMLESYIQKHTDAQLSHGICPECAQKLYPDFFEGN